MASKRIYTCDHCGKELNAMHDFTETNLDDFDFYAEVDLCEKCYGEISKIVHGFCNIGKEQNERDI